MRRVGIILAGLLVACAKVGPPAGGEVDRTAPTILSHRPLADATGVPLETPVEILFSEGMDPQRSEEAIFVTPEGEVGYSWRGERLILEMSLQTDRTYVITVGTGASDLRRNGLEQSFTFAFATGDRLNQGQIEGYAYKEQQPAASAHVWAYDLERFSGRVGQDAPQYRTQSGRNGSYAFSRLATGRYRLLAFEDKNRNQEYDEGEWLGLPSADIEVVEGDTALVGDMALAQHQKAEVRLARVQAVDTRRLLLQFAEEVEAEQVELALEGLEVEGLYRSPKEGKKLYVRTSEQERGKPYSFSILKVDDRPLEWEEKIRGSGRQDRTRPELVSRFPEQKGEITAEDTLKLIFGEAMEPVEVDDFWVESDSMQAPEGIWRWAEETALVFVPTAPHVPGEYRLQGRGELLRDLAGLALKDSVVSFAFTVLGAAELGRIGGRVSGGEGEAVRVLVQGKVRTYQTETDSSGRYALEGLLPGKYTVYAFVDGDGDEVQDFGSLEPFASAEPYGQHRETVSLEAGGAVEEIDFECR